MVSKMKAILAGVFVLGLVMFGAQSDARAQAALPPGIQAEISTAIADTATDNDVTILEDGLFAIVGDDTALAGDIAGFAADNLPDGVSGEELGDWLAAIARGLVAAAPDQAGAIKDALTARNPEHVAAIDGGIEDGLTGIGTETAAGTAAGGGRAQGRGQQTLGSGAENAGQVGGGVPVGTPSTSASPDGSGGET